MTGTVAVIITARNAEATIGDAVQSALDEPEVAEVMVVDDASTDRTGVAARTAAAGDKRLVVLRQEVNLGPAAARNLAIVRSTAPCIAILDADDYLLPGRFAQLLCHADWDIIADNIVFVPESAPGRIDPQTLPRVPGGSEALDLEGFVRGNISHRAVKRGELGFLKPVIRRSILPDGLVYDPALWLGEDYDLYVRLLLQGARFRLTRHVGYAARVRANSLSGQHRTGDLHALLGATSRHIAAADGFPAAQAAMRRHQRQVRDRYLLRSFLDRKAAGGVGQAVKSALSSPSSLWPIAGGILSDKLAALLPKQPETLPPQRILLPVQGPSAV
jgi:succinoglycan biosynthesis protein ExoU